MKAADLEWWAHRGGGKGPLENTLEGFEKAVEAGFEAVEFDIMLSHDASVYLHHDFEMGRLSRLIDNGTAEEGHSRPGRPSSTARFADLSDAELAHFRINGQPIPRFDEFAEFLFKHGLQANVELKAETPLGARRLGEQVAAFIVSLSETKQAAVRRDWVFSSFYHACLLPLQGFRLGLLYEEPLPDSWITRAEFLKAEAIHMSRLDVDETTVRRVHASRRLVRIYTVNSRDEALKLMKMGVDGLFTDDLSFAAHDWASALTAL